MKVISSREEAKKKTKEMKVLGPRSPWNGEAKTQGKEGDGEGSKGTNQIFVVC